MADFGIYRGRVVNNNDPTNTGRMKLQVPQLFGQGLTNWALPAQHIRYSANVGDQVWVSFDGGDTSKPLWWGGEPDVSNQINAAETYAFNLANQAQTNAAGYADVLTRNNWANWSKLNVQSIAANTWTTITGFNNLESALVEDVDQNTNLLSGGTWFAANVPGQWMLSFLISLNTGITGYQTLRIVDPAVHVNYGQSTPFDSSSLTLPILSLNAVVSVGGASGASVNQQFAVQILSTSAVTVQADNGAGIPTKGKITMLRRT